MFFRKEQNSTFQSLTWQRAVKSGGTVSKGETTAFVFLSLGPCYLDSTFQVPAGSRSEDGHWGPWVLAGVLSGQHVVPCDWLVHFSPFLPSVFRIPREPRGLPRLPDDKQSGQKCGSLNAARVLGPGEHMLFHLVDLLSQLLGFQILGTPGPSE